MPGPARNYETLEVSLEARVATVTLNRPKVHNAFDEVMISELGEAFGRLKADPGVRVVVITGAGKSFCAGADIHWMKKVIDYTFEENLADNLALSETLRRIHTCPRPVIARVNGAAIGGGAGIASACDIAVASERAVFSLSEVRLGLLPACAVPYLVGKVGPSRTRELMLLGERLTAGRALECGLVNAVVPHEELDEAVRERVENLLASGPEALAACKRLVERVSSMDLEEAGSYTAETLARLRIGEEGQEGMRAFLSKRPPSWTVEGEDG